jgi:Aspartyl protease
VSEVSFDYLQHLVTVPVSVNGIESRFVLDSGIGLTLLRNELADAAGVRPTAGSFTGRRMSGQSVTIPLGEIPTMTFAGSTGELVEVGVFDMSSFPSDLAEIGGFLSLAFFADRPMTVDYGRGVVIVETRETLAARYADGVPVAVDVQRDGPSVTMFMPLTIPGGRSISVEIDMGSDELILDERLAEETGASLDGDGVRRVEGTDETGHAYTRRFTRLAGRIHPSTAAHLAQDDPDVIFQRIIHDGLVGHSFLRQHVVTFDVAGAAIVLG